MVEMMAWLVSLIPAFCMALGSMAVLFFRVSDTLQCAMQNFSAGLLLTAIANELFPLLNTGSPSSSEKPSVMGSYLGLIGGFVVGLVFMFGLERLMDSAEDDDEDDDEDEKTKTEKLFNNTYGALDDHDTLTTFNEDSKLIAEQANALLALVDQRDHRDKIDEALHSLGFRADAAARHLKNVAPLDESAMSRLAFHSRQLTAQGADMQQQQTKAGAARALSAFSDTLKHIHEHVERTKFQRWKPQPPPEDNVVLSEIIPWATVSAVVIDAGVDGLLIGLAYAAAPAAGISMCIATCIEMAFLGLSLSATIQNATRSTCKHMAIVLLPPVVLFGFGLGGFFLGGVLSANPAVFIGFIAFSIVALLFLITQELLIEAREVAGENTVLNAIFFIGILAGIVLDRLLA